VSVVGGVLVRVRGLVFQDLDELVEACCYNTTQRRSQPVDPVVVDEARVDDCWSGKEKCQPMITSYNRYLLGRYPKDLAGFKEPPVKKTPVISATKSESPMPWKEKVSAN
jgi:hypothetical protein